MTDPIAWALEAAGTSPRSGMRQFQRWGWGIAAAVILFDGILVHDLFQLRPGEHTMFTKWHGAPWPVVLLLAVPLAHVWLLAILVRGALRAGGGTVSRKLTIALLASVAVFHALIWDNGAWVKRLLSLAP